MLTEVRRARDRAPDGVAIRCSTGQGGWSETTWAELYDAAAATAARARRLPDRGPVVVVTDGTAASVATIVGVVGAGVDALLVETGCSDLDDPRSPVHRVGVRRVIGPADAGRDDWDTYPQFRAPHEGTEVTDPRAGEVLQLTSGSTGVPRITRQPRANALIGGELYRRLFAMTHRDTVVVAVPVVHSYGLAGLCSALAAGATLVTLPHFGLRALTSALHGGASVLLGTPLLYRLLRPVLAARGPARLRTALSAGGPLPSDGADELAAVLGTPVRQIYGTTEAGLIACVPRSMATWPAGSAGRAAPGVTLRLDDADGAAAGTGRLYVRTPMMFSGYHGDDRPALTADGFYDTGDMVRIDPDGHLFVLGRKESVVNVGGRKVSAQRIERILRDHPGVREVSVFGVERADHEQEMHAAVALTPPTSVGDLLTHCQDQGLRSFEIPRQVHVLDLLPRNGMGKVDRRGLLTAIAGRASGQPHNEE